jgi:hypothetical protein
MANIITIQWSRTPRELPQQEDLSAPQNGHRA